MPKLTLLQERFCFNLIKGMTGTTAIIKAGSRSTHPDSMAAQLLGKTQVQAKLAELRAELAERALITGEKVVKAFGEIGFLDPAQMLDDKDRLLPIQAMPLAVRRAISGIDFETTVKTGKNKTTTTRTAKLRFCNKNDALDKLAKHLGLFEKDNEQRQGKTVVEILAIVSDARSRLVENVYSPGKLEPQGRLP